MLPMIDARRAEVYMALYRLVNGHPEEIVSPRAAQIRSMNRCDLSLTRNRAWYLARWSQAVPAAASFARPGANE